MRILILKYFITLIFTIHYQTINNVSTQFYYHVESEKFFFLNLHL